MKKYFLTAILFVFTGYLFSQTLTFQRISPAMVLVPNNADEGVSYATLNVSATAQVTLIRTIRILTPSWDSLGTSICNYRGCFSATQDSVTDIYNSGPGDDTISIHFYCKSFYAGFLEGCGYVRIKAYIVGQPQNSISIDFRACSPLAIGIKQISSIVKEFSLGQNYPNPFNPSTKISFSIPKAANTYLKVYDLLGREVKVLVNESLSAGEYEIDFDATGFASGMYYYCLSSGDNINVKKMVLVK
jgi:hypothetical protein